MRTNYCLRYNLFFFTFELFEDDGGLQRRVQQHIPVQCAVDGIDVCQVVDYSSPPSNQFTSPAGYLVIGGSVSPGDSGSGVFDQRDFGTPTVIGVTSAATFGADGGLNHGLITRLDTHRDFLLDGMRRALGRAAMQLK